MKWKQRRLKRKGSTASGPSAAKGSKSVPPEEKDLENQLKKTHLEGVREGLKKREANLSSSQCSSKRVAVAEMDVIIMEIVSFINETISMMMTSISATVQIRFCMTILKCFLKIPTIRSVTPFVQGAVAVLNSH